MQEQENSQTSDSVRNSYNLWADQYDTNHNPTRDLEKQAIQEILQQITFSSCLEAGCGTGKNTAWLQHHSEELLAVDLSEEMLQIARNKIQDEKVTFRKDDLKQPWEFTDRKFDLVVFSLVLEHIENLERIFAEAAKILIPTDTCIWANFIRLSSTADQKQDLKQ
jgi:ubiquinone/menaquinone biosynthesis C-methylase UbiE